MLLIEPRVPPLARLQHLVQVVNRMEPDVFKTHVQRREANALDIFVPATVTGTKIASNFRHAGGRGSGQHTQ